VHQNVADRPVVPAPARAGSPRRVAVLSSFPPTPCGIATFSAALCDGLADDGADVRVVQVGGRPGDLADPIVVAHLDDRETAPSAAAIEVLNDADVVVVQHEYGLYAGEDGDAVLAVLEELERPSIVVAHTVLKRPTAHQRLVLEAVADAADALVVMTEAGRRRLSDGSFDVDPRKVWVIPHGAALQAGGPSGPTDSQGGLLTWGLLGPGKGIEWAIEALAQLDDLRPRVRYCIAGDTHPKVLARDGEAYRHRLRSQARALGVGPFVRFDAGYRDLTALARLIARCGLVVLPYDSPDQVTSGVLVDAIAAGRPVVATAFPHAKELLSSGAGLVVPRRNPDALADAIRRVLTEPGLHARMAEEARRIAPGLAWPAVARRYSDLGEHLLARGATAVA
jgi:polysaccharide biosynthesis protein PslF